eukprot:11173942-Lingulodinium_polyedra.AAC.1
MQPSSAKQELQCQGALRISEDRSMSSCSRSLSVGVCQLAELASLVSRLRLKGFGIKKSIASVK